LMPVNRDLIHRAAAMETDLTRLRAALYDGALQRIHEAQAGLAASRFDAISRSGAPGDPTGSLAMRGRDAAASHADELTALIATARNALGRAVGIVAMYPPARVADAEDRAALERINGKREPCCQNCAELRTPNGHRRWEPIDAAMSEATTLGGILPEPMLLCQWCRKRTTAWGRLPKLDELTRHHAGQRVPWPADVARPA
jgi:hypothetical protein